MQSLTRPCRRLRDTQSGFILKDVAVPEENRLGDEGEGLKIALQCLDAGRINWAA